MFRRSIEWLLAAAVPISLMLTLGADFIVINVFGAKFLPAINSLRILAPLFVPLYLAMLASTYLNLTDRSWRVTWVTLIALTLNALLNLMCIGPTYRALGEGGAGIAAATFSVLCEALVCIALMAIVGAHAAWDRRSVICAVKLAGACVVVSFAHVAMHELGPVRLVIDFALYSVLTILTGAVHVRELYEILTSAFGKRRNAA